VALARIAGWLAPGGRAFVQVFSHRRQAYRFDGTWAAERFFSAGTMPSHDLLLRFQRDMVVTDRWAISGVHYARTLRAWLKRLDERAEEAVRLLGDGRSPSEARALLAHWRLFLLSTAEMWGWRGGREWLMSHYLLERRGGSGKKPLVRATYSA
jgi:cyclopropane-fatty-acyl-phospholipid synthase